MTDTTYKTGDRVRHATLGDGTVVGHGSFGGSMITLTINFDHGGEKELLFAFAESRLSHTDTVAPEIA